MNWKAAAMTRSVRELMQALLDDPTVTVDEAAVLLSVSRHGAYEGVKAGQIPSIRIGRCIRVPCTGLRAMLGIERREPSEGTGHRQDQPDIAKAIAPKVTAARKAPARKTAAPHKSIKSKSIAAE
jgi:excisionase family DNA binding protein